MIRLGETGAPELDRSFRGTWNRHHRPDLARTGTLELSAASPPSLVVDGTLLLDPGDLSHTTLLGRRRRRRRHNRRSPIQVATPAVDPADTCGAGGAARCVGALGGVGGRGRFLAP